jgi:hypothetical protein
MRTSKYTCPLHITTRHGGDGISTKDSRIFHSIFGTNMANTSRSYMLNFNQHRCEIYLPVNVLSAKRSKRLLLPTPRMRNDMLGALHEFAQFENWTNLNRSDQTITQTRCIRVIFLCFVHVLFNPFPKPIACETYKVHVQLIN